MKSEKGITLISIMIYIVVMLIVVVIVGSINMFFYNNVIGLKESANLSSEHNKFNVAFLQDVKEKRCYSADCR